MTDDQKPEELAATKLMKQALSGLVRAGDNNDMDMSGQQICRTSFGLRSSLEGHGNHGFMDLALPGPHLTVIRGAFTLADTLTTCAAAEQDCLRVRLGLSGDLELRDAEGNLTVTSAPECLIAAQTKGSEFQYESKAISQYRQVTLVIAQSTLCEIWGFDLADLPSPILKLVTGTATGVSFTRLPMTPSLIAVATDILECKFEGTLLDQYLEAKSREAICLIIAGLQPRDEMATVAGNTSNDASRISARDREQIAQTYAIIEEAYAAPPTIEELAKAVGLNRNKLCAGFFAEYGVTIHELARELRLQKALTLLQEGGVSITEVAHQVGYGHSSNLSTAVKRRFGVSPKQLRQQYVEKS